MKRAHPDCEECLLTAQLQATRGAFGKYWRKSSKTFEERPEKCNELMSDLPLARIKEIMKQELPDRTNIHADSTPLMVAATSMFIGLISDAARKVSMEPGRRNTLQLKDVMLVINSSHKFDFVRELADSYEHNGSGSSSLDDSSNPPSPPSDPLLLLKQSASIPGQKNPVSVPNREALAQPPSMMMSNAPGGHAPGAKVADTPGADPEQDTALKRLFSELDADFWEQLSEELDATH